MKKRTRNLKVMSILMSVLLILNSLSFYAVAQDTAPVEPEEEITTAGGLELKADNDNIYKKIHFYLGDSEEATIDDSGEFVTAIRKFNAMQIGSSASSMQRSGETVETVNLTIQFESSILSTAEYKAFERERENLNGIEDIRDFRHRLNSYSKTYHDALVDQAINLLPSLAYNTIEHIDYSPFLVVNIDKNQVTSETLLSMAELDIVVSISVGAEIQAESEVALPIAIDELNAYPIVFNGTYTGDGIRIGVYESKGICDITNPNFVDKDIRFRDSTIEPDIHPTAVTSVLTTIAPDATYFVDVSNGTPNLSWFLENDCDIVNCSFGVYYNPQNTDGTYSEGTFLYRNDLDGVFDYQTSVHFLTVVKSAGNVCEYNTVHAYNPNGKITSPGYAYNVITVGGVKRTTVPLGNLLYDPNACYDATLQNAKPNISALLTLTIPNVGTYQGTSLAAPQVAGCLALLFEHDWSYITYPERAMSVMTSTAQKTHDYVESDGRFDSRVGAGVIDLQRMIDSDLSSDFFNRNGFWQLEVDSVVVELEAGDELQVGLSWRITPTKTASNDFGNTELLVTDYDLIVYYPDGSMIKSELPNSNVEMLRLTAEDEGYYTIAIYQYSFIDPQNAGDWLSLTYNIIN